MALRSPAFQLLALFLAGAMARLSAAWGVSPGALEHYLGRALNDPAFALDLRPNMGATLSASVMGTDGGRRKRGNRGGRRAHGDWRADVEGTATEKSSGARTRRAAEDDPTLAALSRPTSWESVQVELVCEDMKVSCDLTTNCNAVSCTKSAKEGSRFSVKQAAMFLQQAVQRWSADEVGTCSIRERATATASCLSTLFPKREV